MINFKKLKLNVHILFEEMCKETDELPPRTPKGFPPPGQKPVKPAGNIEPPQHYTALSREEDPLQGKTQFSDITMSDLSVS